MSTGRRYFQKFFMRQKKKKKELIPSENLFESIYYTKIEINRLINLLIH